jgi:4-hydroxybenzoate polyprenyltransferase
MYAMVDRDEDLLIGVKSTAILFGHYDRIIIGALQVLMLGLLFVVGYLATRGLVYYFGVALAAGFFVYQQYLIRDRDRTLCFRAFLNNHYFGMTVFAAFLFDYLPEY